MDVVWNEYKVQRNYLLVTEDINGHYCNYEVQPSRAKVKKVRKTFAFPVVIWMCKSSFTLSCGPFQHRCLLSVDLFFLYNIYDGVVVLPCMLCHSQLLCHPFLTGIPVFLQSRLQAPFGPSNINQVTAAQYMVYHYTLCTGSPMWYAVSLAAAELLLRKVLHIQMTPEDEHFNQNRGLQGLDQRQKGRGNYHPDIWPLMSLLQYTLLHLWRVNSIWNCSATAVTNPIRWSNNYALIQTPILHGMDHNTATGSILYAAATGIQIEGGRLSFNTALGAVYDLFFCT